MTEERVGKEPVSGAVWLPPHPLISAGDPGSSEALGRAWISITSWRTFKGWLEDLHLMNVEYYSLELTHLEILSVLIFSFFIFTDVESKTGH